MQSGYKLNTGIQAVFKSNGIETLRSILLANILADYGAYEEYPATKVILKDILSNGYGMKVYDAFKNNAQSTKIIIDSIRKAFQKQSNYKEDYVKYVFDSICYGLGLISTIDDPNSNSLDPYANESDDILDKLPEMLLALKKEYDEALKNLLVKPKDIIWDASAYYTSTSDNKLYLILGKIEVLSNQLGTKDFDVYKNKKDQVLLLNREHKTQAVKECIDYKKDEYKQLVTKALVKPKMSYISKSAYLSDSMSAELENAKEEMVNLYKEANLTYDNWCECYKKSILEPFIVSNTKRIRQIVLKIIFPIAIACGSGIWGMTYYSSQEDISIYNNELSSANQLEKEQRYGEAITEYLKAGNSYNASYRTSYYKSEAINRTNKCFSQLKDEINSKLQNKEYAKVVSILNAIPQDFLSMNQENKQWIDNTQKGIVNSVNQEVDRFAEKISNNNGKLSAEDKQNLKELLSISPDNYWLKFIWNREK